MVPISCEIGEAEATSGVRSVRPRYFVLRSMLCPSCSWLLLCGLYWNGWSRGLLRFALRQILIQAVCEPPILVCLLPKALGVLRLAPAHNFEQRLPQDPALYLVRGSAG